MAVLAVLVMVLATGAPALLPVLGLSAPAAAAATDDTGALEHQQAASDATAAPEVIEPTEQPSPGPAAADALPTAGADNIEAYATVARTPSQGSGGPTNLRVNHLSDATAADRSSLNFSWESSTSQRSYRIDVYSRRTSTTSLASSGTIASAQQTSVVVPGLAAKLKDDELYYWTVTTTDPSGAQHASARSAFVTAVGSSWRSTELAWTPTPSVSNLLRATVTLQKQPERVILTATGLDTEASRRHVFNVYANGVEVGVGPARRAGHQVSYNAYDITQQVSVGTNVVGLFSYSQAVGSGVLVQVSAYYDDGTSEVLYNSAADASRTQIAGMDDVVYGTSGASIGTAYYTELAQNVDTTAFPYGWQDASDMADSTGWSTPALSAWPATHVLVPSVAENVTRKEVAPSTVTRNSDGTWTVAFPTEVIGDVRLTATSVKGASIRIQLGEELVGGKADSTLRTGNVYDETWRFKGTDLSFSGFSLKGFRYVTLTGYPGTLTAQDIAGIQTSIPVTVSGSVTTSSSLLNDISSMGRTSVTATTSDAITDSVTRERRPYEGDLLIVQPLTYATTNDVMDVRATWNWLLANPSQYTEYRLAAAIGVRDDYMRTADVAYVRSVYDAVRTQVEVTVTVDSATGLVASNGTVDLVDWPRTELSGYDVDGTRYKTVVNVFAVASYEALADLATALGRTSEATTYSRTADLIKQAVITRLYDSSTGTYYDGLTARRALVRHAAAQNSYVALAYGVYSDASMARALAAPARSAGAQTAGSIYMAYFFYKGLYASGNGDVANTVLQRTVKDERTYASVLTSLGATIAPEAWSPSMKGNMSFSHPWGAGGAAALARWTAGAGETQAGGVTVDVSVSTVGIGSITTSSPTARGAVTTSVSTTSSRSGVSWAITTTIPVGVSAVLVVSNAPGATEVTVDGRTIAVGSDGVTAAGDSVRVPLASGGHVVSLAAGVRVDTTTSRAGTARTDLLVIRRGSTYYIRRTLSGGAADEVIAYGRADDTVLVGDWDGDGVDTLAVRRGSSYFVKNSISGGAADKVIAYGRADDTVLVGKVV